MTTPTPAPAEASKPNLADIEIGYDFPILVDLERTYERFREEPGFPVLPFYREGNRADVTIKLRDLDRRLAPAVKGMIEGLMKAVDALPGPPTPTDRDAVLARCVTTDAWERTPFPEDMQAMLTPEQRLMHDAFIMNADDLLGRLHGLAKSTGGPERLAEMRAIMATLEHRGEAARVDMPDGTSYCFAEGLPPIALAPADHAPIDAVQHKPEPGLYAHYKHPERWYYVLGTAVNRTSGIEEVVYTALYASEDGQFLHTRTLADWWSPAPDGGPRFLPHDATAKPPARFSIFQEELIQRITECLGTARGWLKGKSGP